MNSYDFYGRLFIVIVIIQTLLIIYSVKKDAESIKTQQYYQILLLEKLNGE